VRLAALLVALFATSTAGGLGAQQVTCDDEDTFDECNTKVASRIESASPRGAEGTEESLRAAAAEVAGKTSGTTALGPGLGSTINDFLPAIAGALGFTPTTTENGAAAFESNLHIPFGASLQKTRLQVVLNEAEVYEPVRGALPEETREERTAALARQLGDFDDVNLSIAWNYENQSFGRTFEQHRQLHAQLLTLESDAFHRQPGVNQAKLRLRAETDDAYRALRESITADSLVSGDGCIFVALRVAQLPLRCFKPSVRARLDEVISRSMRATVAVEEEFDDQLARTGFYDLPDLVNNQPQFTAQATVNVRQELAGPNELTGSLRYETGFTNLNGLRRACQPRGMAITLDCLQKYARDPGRQASLKRGDRLFVALSYTRRSDYDFELAEDGIAMQLAGTWSFTGEAGLGRYVAFNRDGEQVGRVDLSALYIHHHDDPNRENRFVGSATYTQRINAALSLAAGVSYADKPDFLNEVQRKVTANFGLRYRLIKGGDE
jgi:hypothetical protein